MFGKYHTVGIKDYTTYIAVGDSMSIDLYPALDLGKPPDTPLGAASLLYRNDVTIWPKSIDT